MGNNNTHPVPVNTIVIKICPFDYMKIQELQNIPSNNYKYQIKIECDSKSHQHYHHHQLNNNNTNQSSSVNTISINSPSLKQKKTNNKTIWPLKHSKCLSSLSLSVQSINGPVTQIIFRDDRILHCSIHEVNYWDIFNCHSQSISTKISALDMYSFPIHFFTKLQNHKPSIFIYNNLLQTYYPEDSQIINDSSIISVPEITSPIIQLGDDRLVTSLKNSMIQIWDSTGRKVLKSFLGHPNELIRTMHQMHDGRVITAADHSICVWDMTKFICLKRVNVPGGYFVDMIQLKDRRILTCSDEYIRIWSKEIDGITMLKAKQKEEFSSLYQLKDGRIVTGLKCGIVKIWDLNSLQVDLCIVPFKQHLTDVRMNMISQVNDEEIIVNVKDAYIMVINFK